ncbi:hypothetical protein [Fuchsiella alkaliacetigena]|uniref:hypothetical protein n=1 Tax=Fuchsiella alkaliacetigena TaxID=957042 RepID=UPI00200B65B1|nr:hypothetical protein [Fuchsiella alkaliacetigena]MCK8824705.1 hypothetical protein [Fuchsiella alkaliacetigena]
MPAKYIECNLKKYGMQEKHNGYLDKQGVEKFVEDMRSDIAPEQIYCIERVNCNENVHFLVKYGDKSMENTKRYILSRYGPGQGSGKLCWLNQIRDLVIPEEEIEKRQKVGVKEVV